MAALPRPAMNRDPWSTSQRRRQRLTRLGSNCDEGRHQGGIARLPFCRIVNFMAKQARQACTRNPQFQENDSATSRFDYDITGRRLEGCLDQTRTTFEIRTNKDAERRVVRAVESAHLVNDLTTSAEVGEMQLV